MTLHEIEVFKSKQKGCQVTYFFAQVQPPADEVKKDKRRSSHQESDQAPANRIVTKQQHAAGNNDFTQRRMLRTLRAAAVNRMTRIVHIVNFIKERLARAHHKAQMEQKTGNNDYSDTQVLPLS